MADILPKELLFNDGEALEHTDLNTLQRQIQAYLADAILGGYPMVTGISAREFDLQPSSAHRSVVSFGNGGAVKPPSGIPNREVDFQQGLIGVPSSSSISSNPTTGDAPATLWYYMTADDVPDKVRPNITTNPRWDLLTVELAEVDDNSTSRDFRDAVTGALSSQSFNKRKKVQATFTWTQGTEAASPVEPAVPANNYKICAVKITGDVPFTALGTTADSYTVRDHRIPIGNRILTIEPNTYLDQGAVFDGAVVTPNYSTLNGRFLSVDTSNTASAFERFETQVLSPINDPNHRLRAVYIHGEPQTNGWDVSLVNDRSDWEIWPLVTVNGTLGDDLYELEAADFSAIDVPCWANGTTAGVWAALEFTGPAERRIRRLMCRHEWKVDAHTSSNFRYIAWDYWGT